VAFSRSPDRDGIAELAPQGPGEMKMQTTKNTICGKTIKYDNSGVGHNWRVIDADDIPASIAEEIAAEIIDGGKKTCDDYVATNGLHYRW